VTGASVTLKNLETNDQHYSVSSGEGEYRFDGVKPGTYRLKINSQGFDESEVPNIVVRADDNNRIDQTLSIAAVTAEVTIEPPQVIALSGAVAMPRASHPLVKAAMDDDLEELKNVLLTTPDANVRDKETQESALEHAVRNGNRDMVQVLLWAKADVNARDTHGQTVLMMLSDEVTSEIVWDLINAGAKVNIRDNDGDTALISAAEANNPDALKTLLDAGAKVNATNNNGKTALMLAASSGLVNNVRALILAGADVNARDKEGKTALMYAVDNDERAAARLLKSHGAIEFPEPEKP
jgi:ankyrin repeat protein